MSDQLVTLHIYVPAADVVSCSGVLMLHLLVLSNLRVATLAVVDSAVTPFKMHLVMNLGNCFS